MISQVEASVNHMGVYGDHVHFAINLALDDIFEGYRLLMLN
ncbi:hypothetical protein UF75_4030 [Desulfosporosinus sp. I2]|nr:hypothetical protein [Desulfosporosinus sp. I2]KJR45595.1 hypothetical protein UF75_4030 [Desulfosporosinus sp. I2]